MRVNWGDLDLVTTKAYLFDKGGKTPKGKVLVVESYRPFGATKPKYAISYEYMRMLPADRIPRNIGEVEFLMIISYDYTKVGTYSPGNTAAIQEQVEVKIYSLPDGTVVRDSGVKLGGEPPQIHFGNADEKYVSGTMPKMDILIYQALEDAINR